MKKKYFNKQGKGRTLRRPEDKLEYKPQQNAEFPKREAEINPDFQKRAFRDLSFNSIVVPVDPANEVSYQADPYAIVNRLNQVVDAKYPGSDNLSGSIVPQLAQASDSTFDNVPDSIQQEVKVNIYYCKTNSKSNADVKSTGKGTVNLKMDVPYDDIINSITAEAYYDLNFFKWFIPDSTDPEYSSEAVTYSDDGQLDVLLNYQSIVQTLANIPLRYKVIRSLEKELKDMSYYNGSGRMNRLFGLLKKSSFVSAVKSVSESLMNHYMDEHWFAQVSMLVAIPCRKAEDMLNPLIDIIPTYDINEDLKVWASKEAYDTSLEPVIDFGEFHDLMDNAREFMLNTSPQFLLSLVRDDNYGTDGINDWINGLVDNLDVIVSAADTFRSQFADLLVAFKRMSKVGITDWKTGFYLPIDKIDETYQPKFNKLAYDIIRASYTGSVDYKYIDRTGQWECHDAWDKFLGIASYSYKSGGCPLLASTRDIIKTDAPASAAVPVLFYGTDGKYPKATILTRRGNTYELKGVRSMDFTADPTAARVLGRLVPISGLDDDKFIIPEVDLSSQAAHPKDQGWVDNLLNNLLPYHRSLVVRADDPENNIYNYSTSPDALCFIDVEIEDQTNAVETYVRQHSPFRVVKTTTNAVLGFTTTTSKNIKE